MVAQTKRNKVLNSLAYLEDNIHEANDSLRIEEENAPEYTTTYKSGLDASAKNNLKVIVKMLRWLASDLGITTLPAAFTDAQVDAIDPTIRTQ